MLILTRKAEESIKIGEDITVTVVAVRGNQVRLGIDAPKEIRVFREEISPFAKRDESGPEEER